MPVEDTGGRLRLTDVADVKVDHQPLIGDAVVDDGDGPAAGRREVPGREHARGDAGRRGGARGAAARALRHADGHVRVPPGDLIEDAIDNLTLALIIAGRAPGAGARRLPVPVAHGVRSPRHDPGVAGGRGAGARPARRDLQRDLVRRAGGRGRDRDRRRRRRAPRTSRGACAEHRAAGATARPPTSSWRPRTRCAARSRTRRRSRCWRSCPSRSWRAGPGPSSSRWRSRTRWRCGGHARRAHAHPGAEPGALLVGSRGGRESPLSRGWHRATACALGVRPQAADGARRRGRGRVVGLAVLPLLGTSPDPLVQGQGRARPAGRRARDVQPADDRIATALSRRAASHPGGRQRRCPRRARRDRGPGRRRQLQRAVGQHRLGCGLRRDGRVDRGRRRRSSWRRARRRHLLGAEDQGRRRA